MLRMNVSERRQVKRAESMVDKEKFASRKNLLQEHHDEQICPQMTKKDRVFSGELILEKQLSISKNEEKFYNDKRVFTNIEKISLGKPRNQNPAFFTEESGSELKRYPANFPSFLRMMDNPNYRNVVHKDVEGKAAELMQIVSKNQGWITVERERPSRKRPVEKAHLGDATKTNRLSPQWMQILAEKPLYDPMKPSAAIVGVRAEKNRTILIDKDQPKRSIYDLGSVRHNVHSKEEAQSHMASALKSGKVVAKPVRFIEWLENCPTQKYDGKISPKIGSHHE